MTKAKHAAVTAFSYLFAMGSLFAESPATIKHTPSATETPAGKGELQKEDISRLSEAFGHFIGRNLNNPGVQFDIDSLIKGIRNGAAGQPAPMSDQEYEEMMGQLQEKAFKQLSTDNLKAANDYLVKNAKAVGVKEIEPGKLQYLVIKEGNGPVVQEHGTPQINYVGKYIDGTVFGNSQDVGGAITIPLDQTIPGFSKGIAGMKEGEKRRLFVHPDLGYGTNGQLPPNSLLIFEVEVVKATSPEKVEDKSMKGNNLSMNDGGDDYGDDYGDGDGDGDYGDGDGDGDYNDGDNRGNRS